MPISIDWGTKVINVPQNYLTNVTGTLYSMDTDEFRLDLKDLEDSEAGMPFGDTHTHNTEVTVAGTTYARFIEILSPYSVTFEDGQYSVLLEGSNNNIFDVQNGILNQNQVQVIPGNTAGLIVKTVGSGVTEKDKADIVEGVWGAEITDLGSEDNIGELVHAIWKLTGNEVEKEGNIITVYRDDGETVWRKYDISSGRARIYP